MLKICRACGQIKDVSAFYHAITKNGVIRYTARCVACHLEICKKNRDSNNGKIVRKKWLDNGGRDIRNKAVKEWKGRNPDRLVAHSAVSNAIRDNRLERQPCSKCGNPLGEAHHTNYEIKLNVEWLCKKCHIEVHYKKT